MNTVTGQELKVQNAVSRNAVDMTVKIGICSTFQVQCVHEPFPGSEGYVFGRMCIRFADDVLGDFDEPACMLDVTARYFDDALKNLVNHSESEFSALTDVQVWERLDYAIYEDDNRTNEQVAYDASRYYRFDFLTNGGESFDNTKSFFVANSHEVRILFQNADHSLIGKTVERNVFVKTLQIWLQWFNHELASR
jgi:hypothetical protein